MDAAYGRALLPNSNLTHANFVSIEGASRRTLADRGSRCERLDLTACDHEARYRTPEIPSVPKYMYNTPLQRRNAIFEGVLRKNNPYERIALFERGERAQIAL